MKKSGRPRCECEKNGVHVVTYGDPLKLEEEELFNDNRCILDANVLNACPFCGKRHGKMCIYCAHGVCQGVKVGALAA